MGPFTAPPVEVEYSFAEEAIVVKLGDEHDTGTMPELLRLDLERFLDMRGAILLPHQALQVMHRQIKEFLRQAVRDGNLFRNSLGQWQYLLGCGVVMPWAA